MSPFDYVIMLFATHFLIVFCSLTLAHVVIVICYVSPNFNPLSTNTEMFRLNLVNTVTVYALTTCAAKSSAVMAMNMQDTGVIFFHGIWFNCLRLLNVEQSNVFIAVSVANYAIFNTDVRDIS